MGEPADLAWRRRGRRHRRVVLLVDVSGSMSGYADPLLRLAHRFVIAAAAAGARREVEVFTIGTRRSEEHTSELQSLMRISYAVFCLKKKKKKNKLNTLR